MRYGMKVPDSTTTFGKNFTLSLVRSFRQLSPKVIETRLSATNRRPYVQNTMQRVIANRRLILNDS